MSDDFDFEAALTAQVASQQETPTDDPDEAPADEAATAETETVEPEPDNTDPEPEPEPGSQYPDEIQRFLDKYDGNIEQALKAAVHAQSTIGQQGQELGELRRMVQELYERPQPQQSPSPFVPENVQEAIVDNPAQVAQWAIQQEQPHVYEAAISEWYEQDPKAAGRFERALEREMLKQELQQQINPEIEAVREQQKAREVADAHRSLAAKYPDFQQVLETATADEVAGIDRNLLASAANPAAALEIVYRWVAMGRGQQKAAETAQRTEQVRQEKREATVVTADATNTPPEQTVVDRLKEMMLSPEPQSVSHGLTR